jgi:hypothetical protein
MTTSYRYDDPRDNLPATTTDRYDDVEAFPQALFAAIHLTKEIEWQHCYARLCHLVLRNIQFLMRSGILSQSESTRHDDWFTAVSSVSDTLPDFHSPTSIRSTTTISRPTSWWSNADCACVQHLSPPAQASL